MRGRDRNRMQVLAEESGIRLSEQIVLAQVGKGILNGRLDVRVTITHGEGFTTVDATVQLPDREPF